MFTINVFLKCLSLTVAWLCLHCDDGGLHDFFALFVLFCVAGGVGYRAFCIPVHCHCIPLKCRHSFCDDVIICEDDLH